jgi:hypothetical protein
LLGEQSLAVWLCVRRTRILTVSIDIIREPRGAEYRALLSLLASKAASFSLVWQHEFEFGLAAEMLRKRLTPFLLRTESVSEWPGTKLLTTMATIRFYATAEACISILAEAGSLYAWEAPERPEDLAFHGPGDEVVFGSIAHEADSWFEEVAFTAEEVRAAVPTLVFRISGEEATAADA